MNATIHIASDRAGTASIAVDPVGAILFPATVAITAPTFETDVEGEILAAGTHTVTVTMNGVSDIVTIEVVALPWNISLTPETTLVWSGKDVSGNLVASCDHPDVTLELMSSEAFVTVQTDVHLDGPPVTIPITASNYGDAVVSLYYGDDSSQCPVHVTDGRFVSISPDTIINELDTHVYLTVEGSCPGTVALSVLPATGLTVPTTVTLTAGELRKTITCDCVELGDYVITAQFLTKTDTCTVGITEVPVLVKIGPDDDDITMLHVATNRPGTVYLSSDNEYCIVPASLVVDTSLEAQTRATFTEPCTATITATFRSASDDCTITYDASYCYVTGTIIDITGRPKRMVSIVFKPTAEQQVIDDKLLRVEPVTARTDGNGQFEVRLLRGAKLILIIDQLSMRREIEIPDQASVDISEL